MEKTRLLNELSLKISFNFLQTSSGFVMNLKWASLLFKLERKVYSNKYTFIELKVFNHFLSLYLDKLGSYAELALSLSFKNLPFSGKYDVYLSLVN